MSLFKDPDTGKLRWWVVAFSGMVIIFLGYCFFNVCAELENGTRDSVSLPQIFIWLYRLVGKWVASGLVILFGLLVVVIAFFERFYFKRP